MNVKELASEYLKHFTAVLEDDGSLSIKLKDDAPDELKAMVYKTRRGIEPDKYTTEYVRHALLLIAESEGVEDLHTLHSECEPDDREKDLLDWLYSNRERIWLVEEAIELWEYEDTLIECIQDGQRLERQDIFIDVLDTLTKIVGGEVCSA